VTHTGSVVGSVEGKTTVHAGGDYLQHGSDVIGGDGVAISGKTVAIEDIRDTFAYDERQKTRSGGIHVSLKGGAADAVNAVYANAQRAGQSGDNRLKALYAARGAQALYGNGSNPLANIPGQLANSQSVVDNKQGANNGGLSLRIGVGGSSTDAQRRGSEATSVGSNVYSANGDVVVIAREGDLAITGSTVEGINTSVVAAKQLIVTSGRNTRQSRESNKGSSAEIGVTIGSEAGIGIYASASGFRGKGVGDEATYTEARVGGSRGTTTFISGGDTVLEGAQFVGQRVIGQVGGDLIARSQQDSNQYHAKQVAAGIDAAIGTGGGSASGYVSAGKVDSTYTSVREQTGIQAGEGGYQIDVTGKTVLDGAAIASTADPGGNFFRTGSLEWNDLVNQAKYKVEQKGGSFRGGSSGGSGSPSYASKKDGATSVTRAGIADGALIAENGSGLGIQRGVTKLRQDGLRELFDAQKVANDVELVGGLTDLAIQNVNAAYDRRVQRYDTRINEAKNGAVEAERNGDAARGQQLRWEAQALVDERDDPKFSKGYAWAATGAVIGLVSGGGAVDIARYSALSGTLGSVGDSIEQATRGYRETLAVEFRCSALAADCANVEPPQTGNLAELGDWASRNGMTLTLLDEIPDGVDVIGTNGIRNTLARAGQLTLGHDINNPKEPTAYLQYNDQKDALGDLLSVTRDKMISPLTESYSATTVALGDAVTRQGRGAKALYGHSRGTVVLANALTIAAAKGYRNQDLKVFAIGPAVSPVRLAVPVEAIIGEAKKLSGRLVFLNHPNDFVATFTGGMFLPWNYQPYQKSSEDKNYIPGVTNGSFWGSIWHAPETFGFGETTPHSNYNLLKPKLPDGRENPNNWTIGKAEALLGIDSAQRGDK
jgi:hypothetical protein